tara:strand:- start:21 stop:614 length:594 start_codon:yes stop_codon:yes gene_type:complete
MLEEQKLFSSSLWKTKLDLDLDPIRKEIEKHASKYQSQKVSNIGGYQSSAFDYEPLTSAIKNNVPKSNEEMGELYIYSWFNINGPRCYNTIHSHNTGTVFLSGVYYVTVPKYDKFNCGSILFHDPRGGAISAAPDSKYFEYISNVMIQPEENMLYYFPSWLEHEVTCNMSDEIRISVSFNLMRKKQVEENLQFLDYK